MANNNGLVRGAIDSDRMPEELRRLFFEAIYDLTHEERTVVPVGFFIPDARPADAKFVEALEAWLEGCGLEPDSVGYILTF